MCTVDEDQNCYVTILALVPQNTEREIPQKKKLKSGKSEVVKHLSKKKKNNPDLSLC